MNAESTVSVMDQYAVDTAHGNTSTVRAGLAEIGLPHAPTAPDTGDAVKLVGKAVMGLLIIRATSAAQALSEALLARCGLPLSGRLQSQISGLYCVRWMSPDCWLLSCPLDEAFAIETQLRDKVSDHISIVNVSGGYSILVLSGPKALSVIKKSTGYDTHPDNFPAGKVVNTTFAKAQVTLRAVSVDTEQPIYELIVRRSFSHYLWLWLQRAAEEYGLGAVSEQN